MKPNPLLAERLDSPLGLVFSGGGARGAFQVGVWKVLREQGLQRDPEVVSGTSSGALNAALIAAGLTPDQMLAFWLDLANDPPIMANEAFFRSLARALRRLVLREPLRPLARRWREASIVGKLLRNHRLLRSSGRHAALLDFLFTARFDLVSELLDHIAAPNLFDGRPVRERLIRAIGGSSIRADRMRLAINAVDVQSGKVVRIVNHPPLKRSAAAAAHYRYHPAITVDMILASSAIPLLFSPVRVGGDLLWDGGVLVNTPIAPAVALGAKRIVPVLVTAGGQGNPAGVATFGAAIERLVDAFLENAYSLDRKMLLDRNALAAGAERSELRPVELFRAVRPESCRTFDACSYLYFEASALTRMFEAGVEAATDWLERGPELDDRHRE
jgi:NTE family protein